MKTVSEIKYLKNYFYKAVYLKKQTASFKVIIFMYFFKFF